MKKILLGLFVVISLTACKTTHTVYNAQSEISTTNISNKVMSKSIVSALRYKGWRVLSKSDNEILAAINVRAHYAEIKIKFNGSQYTIDHVKSTNLKYNSSKNIIHKNYNRWIKLLEAEISRSAEIAVGN